MPYLKVLVIGLIIFGLSYFYTSYLQTPNPLNKAVADTAVILIGLSMLISSICYFFKSLDFTILYRKQLGLIGFAFGIVHIALSFSALQKLFNVETWQQGAYWPAFTALIATFIFTVMFLVSNTFAARYLGGKTWKNTLRTGYLALILIFAHVVLLKSARWVTWYTGGMPTLPSISLIVAGFILFVVVMRVILWLFLKFNRGRTR